MKHILAAAIFALTTTGAWAQTGSNIGLTEYPGPTCAKPQKPVPPGSPPGLDEGPGAVDAYNGKIRQFNAAVNAYNQAGTDFSACMKAYVENGNADMTRIKQRLDQAVLQANLP